MEFAFGQWPVRSSPLLKLTKNHFIRFVTKNTGDVCFWDRENNVDLANQTYHIRMCLRFAQKQCLILARIEHDTYAKTSPVYSYSACALFTSVSLTQELEHWHNFFVVRLCIELTCAIFRHYLHILFHCYYRVNWVEVFSSDLVFFCVFTRWFAAVVVFHSWFDTIKKKRS